MHRGHRDGLFKLGSNSVCSVSELCALCVQIRILLIVNLTMASWAGVLRGGRKESEIGHKRHKNRKMGANLFLRLLCFLWPNVCLRYMTLRP